MPIPKRSRKGLASIMTHADRSIRTIRPHRAYMRVSAIELEKARRHSERVSILQRLNDIDQRCRDLELEKNQLLHLLGERRAGAQAPATESGTHAKGSPNEERTDRKPPRGTLKTNAGMASAHHGNGRNAAQSSKPAGSMIARMLKAPKREPLRPLPERGVKGLRIKY